VRIDGDALAAVLCLVDADQAIGHLKHVVAQRNNNELRVLGAFLDVVGDDRDVLEICATSELR
jgi:hypothetical protein